MALITEYEDYTSIGFLELDGEVVHLYRHEEDGKFYRPHNKTVRELNDEEKDEIRDLFRPLYELSSNQGR